MKKAKCLIDVKMCLYDDQTGYSEQVTIFEEWKPYEVSYIERQFVYMKCPDEYIQRSWSEWIELNLDVFKTAFQILFY